MVEREELRLEKESLQQLRDKLDHFATVMLQELMRSDQTNGWGFDAIGSQAYTGATAMMYHRSKQVDFIEDLHFEIANRKRK